MHIQDTVATKGIITLRDADTREILARSHNLMVENGGILMANLLINSSVYRTGLSYCALGTGTSAPTAFQYALDAEYVRAQITQKGTTGHTAAVSTFFTADTCSIYIKEVALFGHTATHVPGTGLMFARALLDYDNSVSPRNLMVGWEIPITAAP